MMFSHLSSSIKAPLKYADEACGWEHGAVKWGVANAPCTPVTRCCYSPAKFRTGSSVAAAFCWGGALQVRRWSCWLWASISWRARSLQGSGNPKGSAPCLATGFAPCAPCQSRRFLIWRVPARRVWELLPTSGDEQQPAVFFFWAQPRRRSERRCGEVSGKPSP